MPSRLTVVLVSLLLATPAVIFCLWMVILQATMTIMCPEKCECDPGGILVFCSDLSINNNPLIFPTEVRTLSLSRSNITSLEKDTFISRGLTELTYLDVSHCKLKTIELGAFNGLTQLTYLLMSFNQISEIIPRTFEKLSSLMYLDLAYNRLQHLEVDVFVGLDNVEHINLEGNELQYLHPDLFVGLPNLKYLDLSFNLDLQIPTDRHFINSGSLTHLDISECNVNSVSVETFANVSALKRLDLSNNNLNSVDINILKVLPKLSTLYLYGNPLQCDCQLQEVWRWCQDHNIQTAYGKTAPECDTPSEVQGIWWGVLEKGQCLQGNIYYNGDYENTRYSYTPIEDMVTYKDTDWDLQSKRFNFFISLFQAHVYAVTSYSNTPMEAMNAIKGHSNFSKYVQALVYAVPFIFGTTGNAILLIIIICNKDMRTVPNMYILNLAISDIIYLTVPFAQYWAITVPETWLISEITCKYLIFCRRLSVGLSAYSVAVLSIQRYKVTMNPFHVRVSSQQTWRVTAATICGVWIMAALLALPSAVSKGFCNLLSFYSSVTYYKKVAVFELIVSCVLPLCVIAFSYIMTARHLVKSARPISQETQKPQINTRKNTAAIVLGLTVVFLISYVPYHVWWTYVIFNIFSLSDEHFGDILQYTVMVSTCLLLLNSCLNPVALFCTSLAFRRQFKRYLTCCCKTNPTASNIELTIRN